MHELADRDGALGVDRVHPAAQRLDGLGPPCLQDVAAPRRGLGCGDGPAADQHRGATGGQAAPVLGVAGHRQAVLHQAAGVRGGDQPVAQPDGAPIEWLGGGDHTGRARRAPWCAARGGDCGSGRTSRSAASIVGRFVLALGTAGNTEASATQRLVDAEHAALGVDDRPRVVGRAHTAGPADVPRVADRLHAATRRSPRRRTARPVRGPVMSIAMRPNDLVERPAAQQVERALDAVARADEVGIDVEQVLIDQRVDIRIRRGERAAGRGRTAG